MSGKNHQEKNGERKTKKPATQEVEPGISAPRQMNLKPQMNPKPQNKTNKNDTVEPRKEKTIKSNKENHMSSVHESWFGSETEFNSKTKDDKKDQPKKIGRVFNLNIDPNPRSRKEMAQNKETHIDLVKKMGGKLREMKKVNELGDENREEKLQDIAKIQGARTYFKEVSRRSESMNAVPRLKLRSYDEFDERCKTSTGVAFKGKSCRGLFNVHMTMYAKLLDN